MDDAPVRRRTAMVFGASNADGVTGCEPPQADPDDR
jgi:hypothetical protein